MSAVATVEKVDAKNRRLALRDAKGNELTLDVPESVTNLDAIKKGDKIEIDYYASVALSLKRSGHGAPPSTTVVEHVAGPLPGGMVAREIKTTAEVVKVDKEANTVTLKRPTGELDTIEVSDPAMQADLDKLKKGDKIRAHYAEAVAIRLAPQQSKS